MCSTANAPREMSEWVQSEVFDPIRRSLNARKRHASVEWRGIAASAKRANKSLSPQSRRPYDAARHWVTLMGRLDFIGDLDRSKIVALDFTTAEFREQA